MAAVQINNHNASSVRTWVDEQIRAKRFKRCAHLILSSQKQTMGGPAGRSTQIFFLPTCQRASFDWGQYNGMDLETQREYLCYYREFDALSCPQNCRFYRHQSVAKIIGFLPTILRAAKNFLRPAFQWFANLKGVTQVLLILLVIFLLAPQWIPLLIQLIKALGNK